MEYVTEVCHTFKDVKSNIRIWTFMEGLNISINDISLNRQYTGNLPRIQTMM